MINNFLEDLQTLGRAPATVKKHRLTLQHYECYLKAAGNRNPVEADTEIIITYYLLIKKSGVVSATYHAKTTIVHRFYSWLVDEGYLLVNPAPAPLPMRQDALPRYVPSTLEIQKVHKIFYNSKNKTELRDSVIFDLAYSCGLRRSELADLNVNDIDQLNRVVRVRHGKGNKMRYVPIGEMSLKNVQYYITQVRPRYLDGRCSDALFISKQFHARLKRDAFGCIFKRLREKHNIGKKMTLHTLRHACATDMLREGASIQDVSKILGHVNLMTTQIYTRLVVKDLKKKHQKYHPRG